MDIKKRILITTIFVIAIVVVFYLVTYTITKYTGFSVSEKVDPNKDFKLCLKEKGIFLYINANDPSETLKNIQVNEFLEEIKITNCLRNSQLCLDNGITSFPTWIIDNNKIEKDISLLELSSLSGCQMSA